jgi:2-dehydro-3-deoxygalactonokinase
VTATPTALIAVDWGTTSLRGARLDAKGAVLEEKSFARGILGVAPGTFGAVFDECFGAWMQAPGTLCLISGMAGSQQGWREAPYCPCPAGFVEIAAQLTWITPGRIAIVPGLCCERGGTPDVMRGEEVQILGALHLGGRTDGWFVLPGTHSKWAEVRAGRIVSFRTCMTGEFFSLLSQHSLLARTLKIDAPFDESAFADGVTYAKQGAGLLHTAFSARTLALFGRKTSAALASYLSGLVIGEELRTQPDANVNEVVLIGSPQLTARYAQALALGGIDSRSLGAEATWAGLRALSAHLPRLR